MSEYKHISTKSKSRIPIGILALVVVILIGVVFVQVSNQYVKYQAIENTKTELAKEIEAEESRNKALNEQLEYMDTDEFIEEEANDKLNLIRPDQIKVVPIDD